MPDPIPDGGEARRPGVLADWIGRLTTVGLAGIGLVLITIRWVRVVESYSDGLSGPLTAYQITMSIVSLTAAVLCLLVARFAWRTAGGPSLALFLSLYSISSAYERSMDLLLAWLGVPRSMLLVVTGLLFNIVVCFAIAAGVRWIQQFPTGLTRAEVDAATRPSQPGSRSMTWILRRFKRPLGWLLGSGPTWLTFGLLLVVLASLPLFSIPSDATVTRTIGGVTAVWLCWLYLVIQVRSAHDPEQKSQAQWVIEATVLGGLTVALALVFEVQVHMLGNTQAAIQWLHSLVLPLGLLLFLLSLSVSVFRRGALTSSLVLKRAKLVGAIGIGLVIVFVVSEELISVAFSRWFGLPDTLGGVVAGLLAGAAFGPLRTWWKERTSSVRPAA